MTELLRYEVPGKGRHYVHPLDEHRMPSVTNVLGVLPKPWLAAWAAKEERALVVRTASKVYATLNGEHVGETQFGKCLELQLPHKKAHATIRDSTADDGTQAHAAIEWHINALLGLAPDEEEPVLSVAAECGVNAWFAWLAAGSLHPRRMRKSACTPTTLTPPGRRT